MNTLHHATESKPRGTFAMSQDEARDEGGFVLVGVVMLVLALTILGLSLFSLSGYEAQFMRASYQRTQLFYDAMSGVDRTKTIIATTNLLESAGSGLPLPGYPSIVFAQASQNGESTGVVKWSDPSKHITIRVRAEQPGRPSDNITIEAQFVPESDQSLYRDLIATPGKVFVYQLEPFEKGNIYGTGRIRNPDLNDWLNKIHGDLESANGATLPNVQDFISEWSPSANAVQCIDGTPIDSYRFDLFGARYRIFNGPHDRSGAGFGVYETTSDSITFEIVGGAGGGGTAVWLLPDGAWFERWITVIGSPQSNLVIVAGKGTNTTCEPAIKTGANPGLWFQSGIRSRGTGGISDPGPNLFLVSDGTVALDRFRGTTHEYEITFLSIFAGGVYIRGPAGADDPVTGVRYYRRFQMTHPTNDDAVLDPLYDDNLLPNIKGRNKTFSLVPGSFNETADTNPN